MEDQRVPFANIKFYYDEISGDIVAESKVDMSVDPAVHSVVKRAADDTVHNLNQLQG